MHLPSALRGGVRGGGANSAPAAKSPSHAKLQPPAQTPPTPDPSPQGGGEAAPSAVRSILARSMVDQTSEVENRGPLSGLRVVEMGQLIAGPFCGQLLGDLGADVVKVEAPGQGDPMRAWGQPGYPLFWEILSRNKRTVSLDLRQAAGQDLARRLIAQADILIENFRP